MATTSAPDFATFQRETVRHQLERQAGVFTIVLAAALAMDAWRLHPSAAFAGILRRLPIQIAVCGLVFVLLRFTSLGARRPIWLGAVAYVTAAAIGGALLGDLGGFDGPFFYASYVLPTFVMMLSCRFLERALVTTGIVLAFSLAFFLPHPDHLHYAFAHIALSYLAVIIAVNIYFGHKSTLLLEERFLMERLLERHGRALAEDNSALSARVRHQADSVSALLDELESTRHRARSELARDLHDGMAQLVVGTRLELHQIDRTLSSGAPLSNENLSYLHGLVDKLDRRVREMVQELRDPSASGSLAEALGKLEEAYANVPDLKVTLHLSLDLEPSDASREVVVGVVREALTNAAKHARAERVEIHVVATDGTLHLRVEDDGDGLDELGSDPDSTSDSRRRFGLIGMRERVEAAGGVLGVERVREEAEEGSRAGTRVWARLSAGHPAVVVKP